MKPALDFSILDEKQPVKMPVNEVKSVGQCKTTPAIQNASQATLEALQGIDAFKVEISQGIRAGSDPYSLLLKAVQLISILTSERDFYTIHRDVMQGMGMLKQIPEEWERDRVNASLQKLEASRRNIDAAIAAHKQLIDGKPIDRNIETDNGYIQRIKKCFAVAYRFIDEHKHARTHEDFANISIDLGKVGGSSPDPLLKALLVAVCRELEREYIELENPQKE